jgi:hypothetical protein
VSFGALSYLGMVIRFFERTDLAACEQLFDSNIPKFFAEEERVEFTEYLNRLPGPYLVLEEDGEVVACGGWAASRTTPNEIILCWGMVSKDRAQGGSGKSPHEGTTGAHLCEQQRCGGFADHQPAQCRLF